ncbi:uncharacterized protein [Dermacentor albipictus]|uniref:uncharacterized protein n=1 Tax=Dermacentor albipictus TaxID=60249 RepID=UPI0038FC999A
MLLLLLIGFIYFIGFSGSSDVEPTGGEAEGSGRGHGGGGGGVYVPRTPPSLPPTTEAALTDTEHDPGVASPTSPKPGTTTPSSRMPASPKPSSTTPPPPPLPSHPPPPPPRPSLPPAPPPPPPPTPSPPTTTRPPAKQTVLSCTVGHQAVIKDSVPPDGTCDSIFYTDVFFNDNTNKIEPLYSDTAFEVVRSAAARYSKTTFGTSMYPGTIGELVRNKQKDIESAMTKLINDKFVHFGMLNVDNIEDYDKLKDGPLQYLRIAGHFQTISGQHCALGVGLSNGGLGTLILDKAKLATQHFPKITLIVIKVHTERAGNYLRLYPVSPNPDNVLLKPYNTLSLPLLGLALPKRLQELTKSGLTKSDRRYALLSFAMFARAYRMPKTWTDARNRSIRAQKGVIMEYRMVCRHSKITQDARDIGSSCVANTNTQFLALFDTTQNVTEKIGTRKMYALPDTLGGIMAYRVDMDDYSGSCGEGKFPRLKALRSELLT